MPDIRLLTIGHGTLDAPAFVTHLRAAQIDTVADVRRFPASRRHPQFEAAELRGSLDAAAIAYHPLPELGGRRTPEPASPNTALRNASFRGFADYMQTPEFSAALADLMMLSDDRSSAIMCAETLWWRCHRRLIADAAVLLYGAEVTHLVGAMRAVHIPTPGVRRVDGRIVYDGG